MAPKKRPATPPPADIPEAAAAAPRAKHGIKAMALVFSFFGLAFLGALGSAIALRYRAELTSIFGDIKARFAESAVCLDENPKCAVWASAGECDANPGYMKVRCHKSCGMCGAATVTTSGNTDALIEEEEEEEDERNYGQGEDDVEEEEEEEEDVEEEGEEEDDYEEEERTPTPRVLTDDDGVEEEDEQVDACSDADGRCPQMAKEGKCESDAEFMEGNCPLSCKLCTPQKDAAAAAVCADTNENCEFWASIGECDKNPGYMLIKCAKSCKVCDAVEEKPVPCKDRHPTASCRMRRKQGECEKSPGWMTVMCAATCNACHLLPQKARCRPEVFNDVNYRYENALEAPGDLNRKFEHILAVYPNVTVLSRDPYIIKLHNFVSELERETLLRLTLPNVRRSTDQGAVSEEGIQEQVVSTGRTSENAWCLADCMKNSVVANLTDRISTLLNIPTQNFESYQVLQYKIGQFYNVHHDSGAEDVLDMSGPRILTFFIYFSDVEEGGETEFDKLGIKVKPELGSAILWPSVLNSDPKQIDQRTTHAALPVKRGVKHAANVWVHMRDFSTPNLWGCTGSFDE